MATDAFLVQRSFPGTASRTTILAGYPWFADWGRDAFVALPGLLLCTGRFAQAREVFRTFAEHLSGGMIPNRFDDYSNTAHYNSIDASLWFIVAAERYLAATGDQAFWHDVLMPTANAILTAYRNGTRFDIHADADGLLHGRLAHHATDLDGREAGRGGRHAAARQGRRGQRPVVLRPPHHGPAVRRPRPHDWPSYYAHLADLIGPAFVRAFWNASAGLPVRLHHRRRPRRRHPAQPDLRRLAAAQPPVTPQQQVQVVQIVRQHLLTPLGLRSLSPTDSRYRRRYGGSWESRDRAYHQGTVWAWLIGPYVEAFLKVQADKTKAVAEARRCLHAFDAHLAEAGLGSVSEIFDGDAPHYPHGCIAQAWSVAEVLRAKLLVEQAAQALKKK